MTLANPKNKALALVLACLFVLMPMQSAFAELDGDSLRENPRYKGEDGSVNRYYDNLNASTPNNPAGVGYTPVTGPVGYLASTGNGNVFIDQVGNRFELVNGVLNLLARNSNYVPPSAGQTYEQSIGAEQYGDLTWTGVDDIWIDKNGNRFENVHVGDGDWITRPLDAKPHAGLRSYGTLGYVVVPPDDRQFSNDVTSDWVVLNEEGYQRIGDPSILSNSWVPAWVRSELIYNRTYGYLLPLAAYEAYAAPIRAKSKADDKALTAMFISFVGAILAGPVMESLFELYGVANMVTTIGGVGQTVKTIGGVVQSTASTIVRGAAGIIGAGVSGGNPIGSVLSMATGLSDLPPLVSQAVNTAVQCFTGTCGGPESIISGAVQVLQGVVGPSTAEPTSFPSDAPEASSQTLEDIKDRVLSNPLDDPSTFLAENPLVGVDDSFLSVKGRAKNLSDIAGDLELDRIAREAVRDPQGNLNLRNTEVNRFAERYGFGAEISPGAPQFWREQRWNMVITKEMAFGAYDSWGSPDNVIPNSGAPSWWAQRKFIILEPTLSDLPVNFPTPCPVSAYGCRNTEYPNSPEGLTLIPNTSSYTTLYMLTPQDIAVRYDLWGSPGSPKPGSNPPAWWTDLAKQTQTPGGQTIPLPTVPQRNGPIWDCMGQCPNGKYRTDLSVGPSPAPFGSSPNGDWVIYDLDDPPNPLSNPNFTDQNNIRKMPNTIGNFLDKFDTETLTSKVDPFSVETYSDFSTEPQTPSTQSTPHNPSAGFFGGLGVRIFESVFGVAPAPTASISQSKETTTVNEPFTVSWNSTDATFCGVEYSLNGAAWVSWGSGVSGSQISMPPAPGTLKFRATCSGSGGTAPVPLITHTIVGVVDSSAPVLAPTIAETPAPPPVPSAVALTFEKYLQQVAGLVYYGNEDGGNWFTQGEDGRKVNTSNYRDSYNDWLQQQTELARQPASQGPAVTFTINGKASDTVSVGDPYQYNWSSTNADVFSSNYSATCTNGAAWSDVWAADNAQGSASGTISPDAAGCTYTVNYTATQSSTGSAASAQVTVIVRALNATKGTQYSNLAGVIAAFMSKEKDKTTDDIIR